MIVLTIKINIYLSLQIVEKIKNTLHRLNHISFPSYLYTISAWRLIARLRSVPAQLSGKLFTATAGTYKRVGVPVVVFT